MKTIYDLGSNNGDDISYYLMKADRVIAVEANPVLCELIKTRFSEELANGKLFIENCVLNVGPPINETPFYIHKNNHVLSTLKEPSNIAEFERVLLPSQNICKIVEKYGDPYYIKLDIEHVDHLILRELLINGIIPPFISAESHTIEIFTLMVALGGYNAFKLVDGPSVSSRYNDHQICVDNGMEKYSFPYHSSGPFADDIIGPWMSANNFFKVLALTGLGWKDIHASLNEIPDHGFMPEVKTEFKVMY